LSIEESIKLWFRFAKKSYVNFTIVLSLIVVYSTVSIITLPIYAAHLLFYLYKLKVTGDNYVIVVETGDSRSQIIWLTYYILWAEPNIRAFDTASILRSLRDRRPSGHLERLV
jgi:predicted transcriptional regulator